MTTQTKLTIALAAIILGILSMEVGHLSGKISSLEASKSDVSSSTIRVASGTSTVDVPLMNVLSYHQAAIEKLSALYCQATSTAEICTAAK
jgi:hypothetical protein